MKRQTKRGRGRPPLAEDEALSTRRLVRLPPDLDAEAARVKGSMGWSEWLRGLVEREVRRGDYGNSNPPWMNGTPVDR